MSLLLPPIIGQDGDRYTYRVDATGRPRDLGIERSELGPELRLFRTFLGLGPRTFVHRARPVGISHPMMCFHADLRLSCEQQGTGDMSEEKDEKDGMLYAIGAGGGGWSRSWCSHR